MTPRTLFSRVRTSEQSVPQIPPPIRSPPGARSGLTRPPVSFTRLPLQLRPERCSHCVVLIYSLHPQGPVALSFNPLPRGPQFCPTAQGSARPPQPRPPGDLSAPHPAPYEQVAVQAQIGADPFLFAPAPPPASGYSIKRSRSRRSWLPLHSPRSRRTSTGAQAAHRSRSPQGGSFFRPDFGTSVHRATSAPVSA
ncbi:hypothetical protein NDU88_009709 [Pleurodeles waltl]|uniref:Uncharacterized protein n=1 Tax=Pleurodeles waltl TaxID=8319 RepID=A0AAV7PW10_PLEWA|nr:hypothetical protein NDU88_009709 [Pleurodeles waltl]